MPHGALVEAEPRASGIHADVQAGRHHQLLGVLLEDGQLAAADPQQAGGAAQHGLQQFAKLQLAREIGKGVQQRLLLVGAAALGGEQAGPAQGDTGLGGGGGQDLKVALAEGVRLGALHDEHAERLSSAHQRHVHLGAAVEAGEVAGLPGDVRRIPQLSVREGARAEPLAGGHPPLGRDIRPPHAGAEDAIAAVRIHQEEAEEVVAQRRIAEALDDGATDLVLIGRGGDLGTEPQERGLAVGGLFHRIGGHRAPTTARTSASSASASRACFWTTRSTPPLSRWRSASVRVLAVITTTGMPR